MDQNQYLSLSEQLGSEMVFSLHSEYNVEKKFWKTVGLGKFGVSFDLSRWGYLSEEAMAYDNDLMTSVAIVMKVLSETVYDKDFEQKLLDSINEQPKE